MKLAFYYHIIVFKHDNKLLIPSYLGVFVDSLANEVEELYLVFHEANEKQSKECDYILKSKNIVEVNLGKKTPAWHRTIFHKKILNNPLKKISDCDAFIVRSPSPLAPFFYKYFQKRKSLYFMIVGDYIDGAEHLKKSNFRDKMIYQFLKYNDWLFTKEIRKTNVMVNSTALFEKYKLIAKNINLIKTTTLSVNDFCKKEDTFDNEEIKLLYTGRIDPAKGLYELVEALSVLSQTKNNISLHIVGWEQDSINKIVENKMIQIASDFKVENKIFFHGRKSVGPELNKMYRMCDVYVLPSYHEGFPRTIWEAMANSLPVVATDVGGIPSYLTHNENVILIKPKSVEEIVKGIKIIIEDTILRKKIIANGFNLAKENTLEVQSAKIIEIIKNNNE